tara:strand:+ start:48 stop:398 length:351 start_codon:yes stop_codon:yes gene_type:complete
MQKEIRLDKVLLYRQADDSFGWIESLDVPTSEEFVLSENKDGEITASPKEDFILFFKRSTKYDPATYRVVYKKLIRETKESKAFYKLSELLVNRKPFQRNNVRYKVIRNNDYLIKI